MIYTNALTFALLALLAFSSTVFPQTIPSSSPSERWWSETTEQALAGAGENRPQLLRALEAVSASQRDSLSFLLENMPARDLQSLSTKSIIDDIASSTDAVERAPWGKSVPKEIFLNNVLPYVNASERREDWRAELRAKCLPLVEGCQTPAEAAQRLNKRLFPALHVKYSTGRAKADQSPSESMSSGLASCTGLSILLVDACRAVGVHARMVGIPDWVDNRGNHTWVEIWDAGRWHFLGAAEPDARGLDHAWFERDAALAQKDSPTHAIYAVSFRKTELPFPIAWGPDSGGVSAENITDHYATAQASSSTRLMIRVYEQAGGPRVAAKVSAFGSAGPADVQWGISKDERADTNDMLTFELPRQHAFDVVAEYKGRSARRHVVTENKTQEVLDVNLDVPDSLDAAVERSLSDALSSFFAASIEQQAAWQFAPTFDALLRDHPDAVRRLAWECYRAAPTHAESRWDFLARQVRFAQHLSPYTVKTVGQKPADGWGLVIAMHGGGGAPKEVNDSQWRIMQIYYRDQPQLGGYLYVALRAPNDSWNGFYDDYVYPLIANLIKQMAVCEDIDLNKVFLIGYSHGGYGAFAIGPKIPDRFAAIHSSAAAATDGETSAKTLRNTPFTFWVGEYDTAFDRRARCEAFNRHIAELRGTRTDIYPVKFELKFGSHHSNLPDRDELQEMLPETRQPVPRELTWEETDGVIKDFYWLHDPHPGKTRELDATCRDNVIDVRTTNFSGPFSVRLDQRLIDFERPVTVQFNQGERISCQLQPSMYTLCTSMAERGDGDLAFSAQLDLILTNEGKLQRVVTP